MRLHQVIRSFQQNSNIVKTKQRRKTKQSQSRDLVQKQLT